MARNFFQRLKSSYKQAPMTLRALLLALVICVVMAGAYPCLRAVVMRVADHMTVTVSCTQTHDGCVAGQIIFQQTFGRSLTADAQRRLNGETTEYSFRNQSAVLDGGLSLHYHLAFTVLGALVETADVTAEAVPEYYTVSSLGMGTGAPLVAWDNSITSEISQDSGGVIPPPNTRAWPPGSGS